MTKRLLIVLLALGAIGLVPFLATVRFEPMTADGVLWVTRGAPSDPGWSEWVFRTSHFDVGYRPLTALSYTLNQLAFGVSGSAFRCVDLALHLTAALLLFGVARRYAADRPAWVGVVAAGVLLCHPVVDRVVPFVARRGYSLAVVCTLAGLLFLARGLAPVRGRPALVGWTTLAALAFACGFLSNEASVCVVPVLPFLASRLVGRSAGGRRDVLIAALPTVVLLAGAFWVRYRVVGGLGGYEVETGQERSFAALFLAAWRDLVAPDAVPGSTPSIWEWVLLLTAVPCYLWAAVARRGVGAGAADRLPLILIAWLAAHALAAAFAGVAFTRQAYSMLAPLGLLVGTVLADTVREGGGRRGLRAVRLAPQLALLATFLWSSPLVHGQDEARRARWQVRHAMLAAIHRSIAECHEPALLRLVLPFQRGDAETGESSVRTERLTLPRVSRQWIHWLRLTTRGRDVELEDAVFVERAQSGGGAEASFEDNTLDPVLVIPEGRSYFRFVKTRLVKYGPSTDRRLDLRELDWPDDRNGYVYLHEEGAERLLLLHEIPH